MDAPPVIVEVIGAVGTLAHRLKGQEVTLGFLLLCLAIPVLSCAVLVFVRRFHADK